MEKNWFHRNPTLSEDDYQKLSRLVHQKAGINLHRGKMELIRHRLAKAVREGHFKTFGDYYQFIIEDDSGDELVRLLDSISTNLTSFFRENVHFEFLANVVLPEWTQKMAANRKAVPFRIWSAGCSTGEEAYSIAMTVLQYAPLPAQSDFKILATDLSTRVLTQARQGIYAADRVGNIPDNQLKRFFLKGRRSSEGLYQVRDEVKRLVSFRRLNLVESFPMKRPFRVIFCRNVMIYFDKETQAQLVSRLYQSLEPKGYLMIGHSEGLSGVGHRFKYIQPTIYRK